MLVFFSDIHLTDGTSGETINPGAFKLFVNRIADLAEKRKAEEVKLVLLGDGLDVIRSSRWLESKAEVRPWSQASSEQEAITMEILKATLDQNHEAVNVLCHLPECVAERTGGKVSAERVSFDYVLGNHDWLVNRFRSTRELITSRLNLSQDYVKLGFPLEYTSPHDQYDVVARHGDIYDFLNYDQNAGRNASSLGDAIVVELVNRFPLEVGRELAGDKAQQAVVQRLKEIDNVRPLTQIPAWVLETVEDLGTHNPQVLGASRRALNRCINDFLHNPAYKNFARRELKWYHRLSLRMLINQLRRLKLSSLDKLAQRAVGLKPLWGVAKGLPASEYASYALKEGVRNNPSPRFVMYGHTHKVESIPLGPAVRGGTERFYLNTGTWRTVWEKAQTVDKPRHFASWKVMSYVVAYLATEGDGTHLFESWDGALRSRDLG